MRIILLCGAVLCPGKRLTNRLLPKLSHITQWNGLTTRTPWLYSPPLSRSRHAFGPIFFMRTRGGSGGRLTVNWSHFGQIVQIDQHDLYHLGILTCRFKILCRICTKYSTDPTQEACARSCTAYGSHPAIWCHMSYQILQIRNICSRWSRSSGDRWSTCRMWNCCCWAQCSMYILADCDGAPHGITWSTVRTTTTALHVQ